MAISLAAAHVSIQQGQTDAAEAMYRARLSEAPRDACALSGLGLCARAHGDHLTALAYFEAATAANIDPDNVRHRLNVASELRSLGRPVEAEKQYRQILDIAPGSKSALSGLGLCARLRKDHEAALAHFEAATAANTNSDNVWPRLNVASELRSLGRPAEAEEQYRQILDIAPGSEPALSGLGLCARLRKDHEAALAHFEAATAANTNPDNVRHRLNVASELRSLGRPAEAEEQYRQILDIAPGSEPALSGLGLCARLRKDHEAALAHFEAATAANTNPDNVWPRLNVASELRSLGRIADAEGLYRGLLDTAPENVPAMTGLGLCARDKGKHEAALVFFKLAVSANMDRHNHAPALEAATELRTLGRIEESEALCHSVLELNPDNVRALLGLGFAARASGRHAVALGWFCEADRVSACSLPHSQAGLEVATQLRLLGKPKQAEAICHRLLETHGQTVPILLGLVQCFRQLGRSSLELLRIAADVDKLHPTPRLEIAVEQRRQGNSEGAIATLEELRRLHRNDEVRVHLELGRTFRQAGRLEDALAQFTQAAELRPDRVEVQMELASVTAALGRPADSRRHIHHVLAAQPHHTGALIAASRIACIEYEYELAEDILRHALAEAPGQLPLQLALANLLRQLGRPQEAAACIDAAAAVHGELPEISAHRAALALDTSEWRGALKSARAVFASAPWHPFLWEQWFRLEQRGGDDAAITACLAAAPAGTIQQQAQHAFRCGTYAGSRWRLDEAIAFQTEALRLNPEHHGALQDLARLSLLSLDIDMMRGYLRIQRRLNEMTVRLQGRSFNISQTHLGQIADEFRIDRRALVTLQSLRKLPPVARAQQLLRFQMKHPDSTAAATLLLIALRQAGLFDYARMSGDAEIPRTIVQYWDSSEPPKDIAALCESWQSLNQEYQCLRFNDKSAKIFLLTHCGINVLAAYSRAREPAQKADIFRLGYLYSLGGVYADCDDRCLVALKSWLPVRAELIGYQEDIGTIGNNFLAAKPGSAVIGRALDTAVAAVNRGDSDVLWLSTGPGALSRAFAQIMAETKPEPFEWLRGIALIEREALLRVVAIHTRVGYKTTNKHWSNTAFGRNRTQCVIADLGETGRVDAA